MRYFPVVEGGSEASSGDLRGFLVFCVQIYTESQAVERLSGSGQSQGAGRWLGWCWGWANPVPRPVLQVRLTEQDVF